MKGKYLKIIHHSLPFGIRRIYIPLLNLARSLSSFLLPIYYFEGEEYSSGNNLKLVYIGRDKRILNYWTERFFRQSHQVKIIKYIPVWRINAYFRVNAAQSELEMAIIEINKITKLFITSKTGFILPRWWETKFAVKRSFTIMDKGDVSRRIRKSSLTCEIKHSVEDFRFFYERMFKPYISMRHKQAAVIPDYKYFLNIFKKKGSEIFFINLNGEPVAGSIFAFRKKVPRLMALGILDGREDIRKLGVIGALYYFQTKYCLEKNMDVLYLGGTSPILTDGLTKFKLSLGSEAAEIKYLGNQYIWLRPLADTKTVRELLKTIPFVSLSGKELACNLFVETESETSENDFENFFERIKYSNINMTKVFCFNKSDLVSEWIKKMNNNKVEIKEFIDVLNYTDNKN